MSCRVIQRRTVMAKTSAGPLLFGRPRAAPRRSTRRSARSRGTRHETKTSVAQRQTARASASGTPIESQDAKEISRLQVLERALLTRIMLGAVPIGVAMPPMLDRERGGDQDARRRTARPRDGRDWRRATPRGEAQGGRKEEQRRRGVRHPEGREGDRGQVAREEAARPAPEGARERAGHAAVEPCVLDGQREEAPAEKQEDDVVLVEPARRRGPS